MAAICDACRWSGTSSQVRDGGRCPECGESIRYDSKPLQAAPRLTLHEFLPRAAKALRAINATEGDDFVEDAVARIEQEQYIAPVQTAVLLKVVLRLERQINDRAVVDFATLHARGY